MKNFNPLHAKATRFKEGYTIEKLSSQVGVPRLQIFQYELGEVNPLEEITPESQTYTAWIKAHGYIEKKLNASHLPDQEIPSEYKGEFNGANAEIIRFSKGKTIDALFEEVEVPRLKIFQYETGEMNPLADIFVSGNYLNWLIKNGYKNEDYATAEDGWSWVIPPHQLNRLKTIDRNPINSFSGLQAKMTRILNGLTASKLSEIIGLHEEKIIYYEREGSDPRNKITDENEKYMLWLLDNGYKLLENTSRYMEGELHGTREIFGPKSAREIREAEKISAEELASQLNILPVVIEWHENLKPHSISSKSDSIKKYLFWLKDRGYKALDKSQIHWRKLKKMGELERWKDLDPDTGVFAGTYLFHEPMEKVIEVTRIIFPPKIAGTGQGKRKNNFRRQFSHEAYETLLPDDPNAKYSDRLRRTNHMSSTEENAIFELEGCTFHNNQHLLPETNFKTTGLEPERVSERNKKIILERIGLPRNKYTQRCRMPRQFHGQEHRDAVLENSDENHPDKEEEFEILIG